MSILDNLLCLQVFEPCNAPAAGKFAVRAGMNAVLVKVADGTQWQADFDPTCPGSPQDVADLRAYFASLGLALGAWTVPKPLAGVAAITIAAAQQADFLCLDVEPYAGFWGANRPAGQAAAFIQAVRAGLGDSYPVILQPDPRPARFVEIRPEEWLPSVDAVSGQHYFSDFGTTPVQEVEALAEFKKRWGPARLIPTVPGNASAADVQAFANGCATAGESGLILWRMGVAPADVAAAMVAGWNAGKPEPSPEMSDSDKALGYAQLTIAYQGEEGARQYFTSAADTGDLDEIVRRIEAVKERYGLAGDH